MTVGKAGLITAGLVGAVALGIAAGPALRESWSKADTTVTRAAEPAAPAPATVRSTPRGHASPARRSEAAAVPAVKKGSNTIEAVAVSIWEPQLRNRAKAVLNRGAKLEIAAEDFATAEQFMAVAHAARNTQVPFMVLKDRVVNQGRSLAQAIHEFKPDLDARAEVTRAHAAAREDLQSAG